MERSFEPYHPAAEAGPVRRQAVFEFDPPLAALGLSDRARWAEQASAQLAEELGLPSPPQRVECYDISNIQGKAPVGSMVVVENGEAARSEYRRFKVRYHPEDPNDFAMMHEVITRRLRNYIEGDEKFNKLPDLIVVDGGKGQLSAGLAARDALNVSVPMVGLAKRHEIRVTLANNDDIEGGVTAQVILPVSLLHKGAPPALPLPSAPVPSSAETTGVEGLAGVPKWTPEHPVVEELRRLDVAHLTPIGALQLLNQWQGQVGTATRADRPVGQPRSGDRQ